MEKEQTFCMGATHKTACPRNLRFSVDRPNADYGRVCFSCVGWRRSLRGVAARHRRAEVGERGDLARRTGVVRLEAMLLGCEAERHGQIEAVERAHHAVEPRLGVRPQPVGPTEPGSQMTDTK